MWQIRHYTEFKTSLDITYKIQSPVLDKVTVHCGLWTKASSCDPLRSRFRCVRENQRPEENLRKQVWTRNQMHIQRRESNPGIVLRSAGAASIFWGISKTRCFWCQNLGVFEKPQNIDVTILGYFKNPKFLTRKIPGFFMSSKSWGISQEITVRIVTLHDELCIYLIKNFHGDFFISMRGSEHFAACCLLYIK